MGGLVRARRVAPADLPRADRLERHEEAQRVGPAPDTSAPRRRAPHDRRRAPADRRRGSVGGSSQCSETSMRLSRVLVAHVNNWSPISTRRVVLGPGAHHAIPKGGLRRILQRSHPPGAASAALRRPRRRRGRAMGESAGVPYGRVRRSRSVRLIRCLASSAQMAPIVHALMKDADD